MCLAGVPCEFGTAVFSGWVPTTDATVVTRILEAGGTVSHLDNMVTWQIVPHDSKLQVVGKGTCENCKHIIPCLVGMPFKIGV